MLYYSVGLPKYYHIWLKRLKFLRPPLHKYIFQFLAF